jgi:hypothetical protein
MKKLALLVLAFVVIGLGASSCGKDKACKCTYTYAGYSESETIYPEEIGVDKCSEAQTKLNNNNLSAGKIECSKL